MKNIVSGAILVLLLFTTCKHEPDIITKDIAPINPSVCDTVSQILYASHIAPLFESKCNSCHGTNASAAGGGIVLTDSASIVTWHKAGRLIGTVRHQSGFSAMPKGSAALTECQIRTIELWLKPIAVVPPIVVPCDTISKILYATHIQPLFDSKCNYCHGVTASSTGASIVLMDSSSIVTWYKASRLIGSLRHQVGYSAMPKGIAALDVCQIRTIEIWLKPIPVTPPPAVVNGCDPDTAYFSNTIGPLLASTCGTTGCHNATSKADGRNLTSYAGLMSSGWVKTSASLSKLYTYSNYKVSGKDPMPPSGPSMSSANIALLATWINQGAKNNSCVSACDTSNVTYSGSLKPYADLSCVGCHNASNASGAVNLDGYTNFAAHASRSLIRMRSASTPMPPSGKPSDCSSRTLEIWINLGKINN